MAALPYNFQPQKQWARRKLIFVPFVPFVTLWFAFKARTRFRQLKLPCDKISSALVRHAGHFVNYKRIT